MPDSKPEMPTDASSPARRSFDSLARAFLRFANDECGNEPVYDAICRTAADDPTTLELLWHAPIEQQKPNLLLASIHDLVLSGTDHALARFFPSVGGTERVDARFAEVLEDFRETHRGALVERIASRSTQTNEIGRCAVLYPCLAHIAASRGANRIALLDFGASAGLNLGVDRYRYDYGRIALGAPLARETPTVPCELRGRGTPGERGFPVIASRSGLDRHPVDIRDPREVRWLRACIWPNDTARAARFDAAMALALRDPPDVRRADDDVSAIERWLETVPRDVLPVVFHSWVLFYFDEAARQRFGLTMERLVDRFDAAWLSAEGETLRIGDRAVLTPSRYPATTAWTVRTRVAGRAEDSLLAWSHPHGVWMEWLV